ncbi:hypothetical protein [Gordonia malaquae]|uniref:hypothetical protein n=1 Tax=Gordonia malaquae TaxID=410332 RepID=UPI0030FE0BDB
MSWWELREAILAFREDTKSSFYRALNPDYVWADPQTQLLAEVATLLSDLRFLDAVSKFEDLPDEYLPGRYGPGRPDEERVIDGAAAEREQKAISVGAELRG